MIMVLSFTGSLSIAEAGQEDIRAMLIGALGCNAIAMLFIAGVAYGRVVGRTPWIFGISMVALGSILVALTIALGG